MGILTILLHPHFPKRSDNLTSHLNMDPRDSRFISIFYGWKMFEPNLKSKLLQLFSFAALLLKNVFLLQPGFFFPQPRKMYFLPITTIKLSINLCATAMVGMQNVHSKDCKNELSNMFPGRSETIIIFKIALIFPVPAEKHHFSSKPMILNSIFQKTLSVPANRLTPNSLFLLEDVFFLHLSTLEAMFIKWFEPNLCRHKEFLYSLQTHSLTSVV